MLKIRQGATNDAHDIARVQVDSWRTTYQGIISDDFLYKQLTYESRKRQWQKTLEDGKIIYVAEHPEAGIVGFSIGGKERSGQYEQYPGELYAIYILEHFQRQGIGKRLTKPVVRQLLEEGYRSMLIWAIAANSSRHFYEAIGGKKIDTRRIEIDGDRLEEIAYGFKNITDIFNL